jgi:hypothetical protein
MPRPRLFIPAIAIATLLAATPAKDLKTIVSVSIEQ